MLFLLQTSSKPDVLVEEVPLCAGGVVRAEKHCVQCPGLVQLHQPALDGLLLLG